MTKLNPTGTAFVYSTFLGGNVRDEAFGIAVDPVGNAHVTGQTRSGSFPLVEAIQSSCTVNGPCTYISSLNASGSGLIFSTFFGQGRGNELVADNLGSIYITGEAFDGITNIPLMNPIQPAPVPGDLGSNAFVSKIQIQQIMPRRTPFDFDGDGKSDISVFRPGKRRVVFESINQRLYRNVNLVKPEGCDHTRRFDGDGKTDVAVFRDGIWY